MRILDQGSIVGALGLDSVGELCTPTCDKGGSCFSSQKLLQQQHSTLGRLASEPAGLTPKFPGTGKPQGGERECSLSRQDMEMPDVRGFAVTAVLCTRR